MMIFSDKHIDYSKKTKKELRQKIILFSILSNRTVVSIGKYLLKIALRLNLPILGIIKKTIFPHFCGGENIIASKKKINELGEFNIKTILDYSIEGKNAPKSLETTYEEILKNLDEANRNSLLPFCVFKFSGIARFNLLKKLNQKKEITTEEQNELDLLKDRLHKICKKAQQNIQPILIDAEESWIQDAIDKLTEELMETYNKSRVIIYHTIQLYRWDKLNYIKQLHKKASKKGFKLGLKLVRGAYMEKEHFYSIKKNTKSWIHLNKAACDADYNAATKYCIKNIKDIAICFGTHNEKSTALAIKIMKKQKIKNNDNRIYFSQLLGMSDNISFQLGHFNYNVAKYVPYGPVKEVIPYLIRRAEENSAISGQTEKEIQRLKKALKNHQ